MTAEEIVRALAASDPVDDRNCGMCAAFADPVDELEPYCAARREPEHEPDCPWRLAVEWVAANP